MAGATMATAENPLADLGRSRLGSGSRSMAHSEGVVSLGACRRPLTLSLHHFYNPNSAALNNLSHWICEDSQDVVRRTDRQCDARRPPIPSQPGVCVAGYHQLAAAVRGAL